MDDEKVPLLGYSGGRKRRRPGRDKESRIKDLSNESSSETESSSEHDKSLLLKNTKGKKSRYSMKFKVKDSSKKKSDKGMKHHKQSRARYYSESSSSSEKYRRKERKLKETLIKRMSNQMKASEASTGIKVSIDRSKYERLRNPPESPKKRSLEKKEKAFEEESVAPVEVPPKLDKAVDKQSQEISKDGTSFSKNKGKEWDFKNKSEEAPIETHKMLDTEDTLDTEISLSMPSLSFSERKEDVSKDSSPNGVKISTLRSIFEKTTVVDKKEKSSPDFDASVSKHSGNQGTNNSKFGKQEKDESSSSSHKISCKIKSYSSTDSEREKKGRSGEKSAIKKNSSKPVSKSVKQRSSVDSSSSDSSSSSEFSNRSSSASKDCSSSSSSSSGRSHHRATTKRRSRSPLEMRHPRPRKLHVGNLTRNVTREGLEEVFSIWGNVTSVELPVDRSNGSVTRGFAYVEYASATEAEKAVRCMNGGALDGQQVTVAPVLPFRPRPLKVQRSPNRRPFQMWRFPNAYHGRGLNIGGRDNRRRPLRSPPPARRRSPRRRLARSRSPRTRSRSPYRRHGRRCRSFTSPR